MKTFKSLVTTVISNTPERPREYKWRKNLSAEYKKVLDAYFLLDPTFGMRFKPNSTLIALESNPDRTPKIATTH